MQSIVTSVQGTTVHVPFGLGIISANIPWRPVRWSNDPSSAFYMNSIRLNSFMVLNLLRNLRLFLGNLRLCKV